MAYVPSAKATEIGNQGEGWNCERDWQNTLGSLIKRPEHCIKLQETFEHSFMTRLRMAPNRICRNRRYAKNSWIEMAPNPGKLQLKKTYQYYNPPAHAGNRFLGPGSTSQSGRRIFEWGWAGVIFVNSVILKGVLKARFFIISEHQFFWV